MNPSIRILKILRPSKIYQNIRQIQSVAPSQWDVFSAVCLQRLPVISPEMNWLERRMTEYLSRVEISESLYSDHEMRHFEDLKRAERIASGVNLEEKDLEEAAKQTAVDFEETSIKELKQFQFASRASKADLTNNSKSIDRSLDKHLYMLTKQTFDGKDFMLFPQIQHGDEDKSLRQSAERLIDQLFPLNKSGKPTVHLKFLGNCPAAYYSYRYPKDHSQSTQKLGRRVFIFKCNLDPNYSGKHEALKGSFGEQIIQPNGVKDFYWLTRQEVQAQVPNQYWQKIGPAILPDVLIDLEKILKDQQNKISRVSNRLKKYETKLVNSSVN